VSRDPLLASRLPEVSVVAFDTEATGYSNVSDRLIEVAGERRRWREGAWTAEDTFQELVQPGRPVPADSIAIHGLTDEALAGAAPAVEVLDRFFAFAADSLLAVHFAPADAGMMAFAYARAGCDAPRAAVLDTSPLSHALFPGLPSYSLEALAERLALPRPTHRALPDARATSALLEACVAKLGKPEDLTVGDLVERAGPLVTLEEFTHLPLELPAHLEAVGRALAEHADLTIEYRGGSRGRAPRRVTPQYLFARQGHIFLIGHCHASAESKAFRLDRIERATLLAQAGIG
jgi:DNA polymerase III epsilon subunit-like protein